MIFTIVDKLLGTYHFSYKNIKNYNSFFSVQMTTASSNTIFYPQTRPQRDNEFLNNVGGLTARETVSIVI